MVRQEGFGQSFLRLIVGEDERGRDDVVADPADDIAVREDSVPGTAFCVRGRRLRRAASRTSSTVHGSSRIATSRVGWTWLSRVVTGMGRSYSRETWAHRCRGALVFDGFTFRVDCSCGSGRVKRSHADWRVMPRASPMLAQLSPRWRAASTQVRRCRSTCSPASATSGSRLRRSSSVRESHGVLGPLRSACRGAASISLTAPAAHCLQMVARGLATNGPVSVRGRRQ